MRGHAASDLSLLGAYQTLYDIISRLVLDYQPHEPRGTIVPTGVAPEPGADDDDTIPRVALFVDAPDHMSGVATTVSSWMTEASHFDAVLRPLYAGHTAILDDGIRFNPVGTLRVSAYEGLQMPVPQVHEVVEFMRTTSFNVVHVSTPGPMGILGLVCARLFDLPVCGTYHTDFPAYAVRLSGDESLREVAWRFMSWFYGQLDRVACPSASTRNELIAHGFDGGRLSVVGRGVDTSAFSPALRNEELREKWFADRPYKLLYVGRVSEEKNLACLVNAFRLLAARRDDVALVVVGDGPYLPEMRDALAGLPAVCTGALRGQALAEVYASCDLFVFPSETDTFGVVLIEAMASGIPVVVSAQGGPKDCVVAGETGFVVDPMQPANLADELDRILADPAAVAAMGSRCRRHAMSLTPAASFKAFWEFHRDLIGDVLSEDGVEPHGALASEAGYEAML